MKSFIKIIILFGIIITLTHAISAQQRQCDLIPQIVYPTKGYLFVSPCDTEIKTAIINLGPDSIFIGDNYSIRFYFGSLITNGAFRKFYKNLAPGDTAFDFYNIHIDLVGDVPVNFCTKISRWADDTTTLAREYGAAKKNNKGGCVLVEHEDTITTGVYNYLLSDKITIYPNPATNLIYLKSDDKILSFTIFDLSGELVSENVNLARNKKKFPISVKGLASGIYFIRIATLKGIVNKKLIIN